MLYSRFPYFIQHFILQVSHIYICDYHKNVIQSVRTKRKRKDSEDENGSPDGDDDIPEVSHKGSTVDWCVGLNIYFFKSRYEQMYVDFNLNPFQFL